MRVFGFGFAFSFVFGIFHVTALQAEACACPSPNAGALAIALNGICTGDMACACTYACPSQGGGGSGGSGGGDACGGCPSGTYCHKNPINGNTSCRSSEDLNGSLCGFMGTCGGTTATGRSR